MPKPEQCCGNCRWYRTTGDERGMTCGDCACPLPMSLETWDRHAVLSTDYPDDCDCWQAKESEAKRDG